MKTIKYILAFVSIIIIVSIFILLKEGKEVKNSQVCINGNCFDVELTVSESEKMRGLMFRESLDEDKGMLFVYDQEGIYPFWMKNTLIPLDIIWIDSDMKIVHINRNTQPCEVDVCPSIDPEKDAMYVLELNAGISEKFGFEVGNAVDIKNL